MAHITEIGPHLYTQRLYWHIENPPLIHRTRTIETQAPFRVGECVVVRVPFTSLAFAFGVWVGESTDEEEALLNAMGARVTQDNGYRLDSEVDW